jgi:hypothetical protein
MTTISRARFESMSRDMVERMAAGPQPIKPENQVHPFGKRVEMPAEDKVKFERSLVTSAASEANFEAFQRDLGIHADRAYYAKAAEATYTKFGKMSTEEKEVYVQQQLADFDAGEALYAERRKKVEESNVPASPTGQAGAENPAPTPVATHSGYQESHEMYFLSNIADLSLEHAKKQQGVVESMISTHEDAGMNVHGRYGDLAISDLNTYLAALKDYISKLDIGASPTPSEPAKEPSSTGG